MGVPLLEDEAQYRRARFVNLTVLVTGGSAIALTAVSMVTNPRDARYYAVFLALVGALALVKLALHHGHVRLAAWASIALIWAALSASVGVDGVTSPALPSYLLLVLMGAATVGSRGAWIIGVASVTFLAAVAYAELTGRIDPDTGLIPVHSRFLTHAAQIFLGSGLVLLISRENRLWLDRATALFENAPDAMLLVRGGRVRRVNRAFAALMRPPSQASMLAPSHLHYENELLTRVFGVGAASRIEEQLAVSLDESFELLLASSRLVECRASRAQGSEDIQLTLRDLTARRALENQLWVAQRMESVARLAGGVAHDFNNLLTVVQNNLIVAMDQRDDPALYEDALAAVDRGAALTRQLLTFARQQPEHPKHIDVLDVVADVRKLLDRIVGEDVRLEVDVPDGPLVVEMDPTNLEQVLLNLAVNARDAMPRGGVLTIAVRRTSTQEIEIEVRDTGEGMDADTRERVFEPFFSTKEAGRGTGLGLAVVHGVVSNVGGTVSVVSARGEGTTFTIRLPIASGALVEPNARQAPSGADGGTAWVFVVEDDAAVRRACSRLVRSLGYRVTSAATPNEALAYARGGGAMPDILLLDTIMPGMTGPDLALALLEVWPKCRVVLTSGYAGDGLQPYLTERTRGWPFLGKPYSRDELARALRASESLAGAVIPNELRPLVSPE